MGTTLKSMSTTLKSMRTTLKSMGTTLKYMGTRSVYQARRMGGHVMFLYVSGIDFASVYYIRFHSCSELFP
jgi:hypothetical protein